MSSKRARATLSRLAREGIRDQKFSQSNRIFLSLSCALDFLRAKKKQNLALLSLSASLSRRIQRMQRHQEGGYDFETWKRTDTFDESGGKRETFDPKIATCDDFIAGKILEKSARSGAKQSEERRLKKKFIETTTTRWARTKSAPCSRSRRPCSRWQRWKTYFFLCVL